MVKNAQLSFTDTQIAFSSKSDSELMKTYALFASMDYPSLVKVGTFLISGAFKINLPIKPLVKHTLFTQFCGGESIKDCQNTIEKLGEYKIGTILDYSVEGAHNDKSFNETEKEIILTIQKAATSKHVPFSVFKVTGIAPVPLLEKVQAGEALSEKEQETWDKAQERVDHLCRSAYEHGVRIFIDAEETWIQKVIDDLAMDMMRKYNKEEAIVYNTYQMYLHAKLEQLKGDLEVAKTEGFKLGVKLVRGAYMEKEAKRAAEMGYQNPIQPSKEACDNDYNAALKLIVENHNHFALCAGTHNEKSSMYLAELMSKMGISESNKDFYFAQLYGMSDHISYNLSNSGYNVAKYVPYGPVKEVMPYLFRRAEENTSIAGQSSREFMLVKQEMKRRKESK
ncbi:proline dehydrogenase family protein [Limibacter armeniacum]|uniref:proline dehydrogenase family protein n=1 Tax=Limibacter armeniacum TaxID=466084 RepID=UPI002FE5AA42